VSSEFYRPAASRGALVFFMMNDLYKIHSFYKFSLDSFVIVVKRAIDIVAAADRAKAKAAAGGDGGEGGEGAAEGEEGAAEGEDAAAAEAKEDDAAGDGEPAEIVEMTPKTLAKRVEDLTESMTYQAFNYTRRGTFE
jgi:dynein heavy chain